MPTVLNAANEEAVAAFLAGRISFLSIEDLIEKALDRHSVIQDRVLRISKKWTKTPGDTLIQYSHKVVCS